MASEDSEEIVSGFTSVHCLHDLDDFYKTSLRLVSSSCHELDARSELLKIEPLGTAKRMLLEKRNNALPKILPSVNRVAIQVFSVVVIPPVNVDLSHSKKVAQLLETVCA
jgi:hypothetical protein